MTRKYITYGKHKQEQTREETWMKWLPFLPCDQPSGGWSVYSAWVYVPAGSEKTNEYRVNVVR